MLRSASEAKVGNLCLLVQQSGSVWVHMSNAEHLQES